jgi:CRP-like cAMP-binding protein
VLSTFAEEEIMHPSTLYLARCRAVMIADRIRAPELGDRDIVRDLERFGCRRTYQAGDSVVQLGDAGELWYMILSGSVVVAGSDRVRAHLGAGAIFGEMAASSLGRTYEMRRTATVTAVSALCVLELPGSLLHESPSVRTTVTRLVNERLTMDDLRRYCQPR